jgi:hypothetical protein
MSSGIAESCPRCSEPRIGLFCEQCGHSYSLAAPTTPSSWCAIIAPDRDYYEAGGADAERFTFPVCCPPRRVELAGASLRVGRDSSSRRATVPEIALADPGVSREHARLLAQSDGTWALIDEGSTNGTYLNGRGRRIPAHQQVPLADGDRVHLGVWTTITVCSS